MDLKRNLYINFNIIIVFISLFFVLIMKPESFESFDEGLNFILPVLSLFNVLMFWKISGKVNKSWVRYDTLFLLGFVVVHFQIPFLESIGISPDNANFVWVNKQVVNYAVWLSINAMLVWILGYLFFLKIKSNIKVSQSYIVNLNVIDKLLIISFLLFLILVGNEFLEGNYDGGKNWGAGASYAFILLRIILCLRIIYFFINTRSVPITKYNIILIISKNLSFILILAGYVLIFLLVGDRGPVIEIGILLAGTYSLYRNTISFKSFLFLIFAGATLMTIIGLGRRGGAENREVSIFEQGYKSIQASETSFNPTNELAVSNRILFRALDEVPHHYNYFYGSMFFIDVVETIPFGASTFFSFYDIPPMFRASSTFFTVIGQGQYYTYGEGTEILADMYINFGVVGIIIIMFFFGYIIGFLTYNISFGRNHVYVLLYLFLLTNAIYINRSNILGHAQILLIAYLLDRFLVRKNIIQN